MFGNIGDMHEINMGIEEHETKEKNSLWLLLNFCSESEQIRSGRNFK